MQDDRASQRSQELAEEEEQQDKDLAHSRAEEMLRDSDERQTDCAVFDRTDDSVERRTSEEASGIDT